MTDDLARQAKLRMVAVQHDWIKKFDVNEYIQNPPLIEKLNEEKLFWLSTNMDLENRVSDLTRQVHELEISNTKLLGQLNESRCQSFTIFGLSFVAVMLSGIGVNIVTDKPYTWVGWILIVTALIIEVLIFYMTIQDKK